MLRTIRHILIAAMSNDGHTASRDRLTDTDTPDVPGATGAGPLPPSDVIGTLGRCRLNNHSTHPADDAQWLCSFHGITPAGAETLLTRGTREKYRISYARACTPCAVVSGLDCATENCFSANGKY